VHLDIGEYSANSKMLYKLFLLGNDFQLATSPKQQQETTGVGAGLRKQLHKKTRGNEGSG